MLELFTSASGRIARKPFWIGVVIVYVASFLTQFLFAAPLMVRASVVPFLVAQVVVAWAWYALHAKRLRDAGRTTGSAVALTVLYGLAVMLLCLVVIAAMATGSNAPQPGGGQPAPPTVFDMFLLLFLLGMILGEPSLGIWGFILLGVIAIVLLPIVIAFAYTIFVGTRPSAPIDTPEEPTLAPSAP
jgi:uncharacterized membrane protein YhaH (DUF805 family)